MKPNHATLAGIVIVIGMVAGIMYGVRAGNAAIPLAAFLAGAFLLVMVRRSVSAVIEDEWTRLVGQKAATMTLDVTAFIFTVIGLFLITVSSPGQNYDQAVYAIAAMLVTISVLQVATTAWYTRKLRGNPP